MWWFVSLQWVVLVLKLQLDGSSKAATRSVGSAASVPWAHTENIKCETSVAALSLYYFNMHETLSTASLKPV